MTAAEILIQVRKLYPEMEWEVLKGFKKYTLGSSPSPESLEEMRGWTMAWGYADRRRSYVCSFPENPDYMAGWEMLN